MVFHPAAVAFSVRAASESGRCVARITEAFSGDESEQKTSRKVSEAMYRSGPSGAPGAWYGVATLFVVSIDGANGPYTLVQLSPSSIPKPVR
jgi:hypothetical protein